MKKSFSFLTVFALLFFSLAIHAQSRQQANSIQLESSRSSEIVLNFNIDDYDFKSVQTSRGIFKEILAPNTTVLMKKGAPSLPKQTASVAVSETNQMQVEVISSKYVELKNVRIAPSKGHILRTVNPESVAYRFGKEYKQNRFYPSELVTMNDPYIIRDVRGQSVVVNPFRYNPISKVLRIYTEVKVKISETRNIGKNTIAPASINRTSIDADFNDIYANHFINYNLQKNRKTVSDGFGNMLIVCHGPFMKEMSDFVSWKQSLGYNVEMVDYSTIGSVSALKKYVKNYYNSKGLTYLLLVGDHEHIPADWMDYSDKKLEDAHSDNSYGYIAGNDKYQDILIGRFSAENANHVRTQIERTIHYERDLSSSADFFKKGIGIASSEGSNPSDAEHLDRIHKDLEKYGYSITKCYQKGGTVQKLADLINQGAGIINYTGHGNFTTWGAPAFNVKHVNKLTNENELPFVISVACVVGRFPGRTCFAESWLRATNNGKPTGAVAFAGSTIYQPWYPPLTGQDDMNDFLMADKVRTFGGMLVNGFFRMQDKWGGQGQNLADSWTCFGDPSVQMRTPGNPNGPTSNGLQAPKVTITNPANGDKFPEGSDIQITATASDKDGTVTQVEFFINGTSIGVDKTAPYSATLTKAPKGKHSVSVVATDNDNLTSSQNIGITVGTSSEDIEITSTNSLCDNNGKVMNEIYFTVNIPYTNVKSVYGVLTNLGNDNYKIVEKNVGFGTKLDYIINVFDGGTQVATKTIYVTSISSCGSVKEYTISASAGANGSISPSGSIKVEEGNSQTFTITANTGYQVKDVTVDGISVGAKTKHTFTSVKANHTIKATFEKDGGTNNAIQITNVVTDCNKKGKARNIIYLNVSVPHNSVTVNRGYVINLGNGNYKIRDVGMAKGSTYNYKITAKNGNKVVGTASKAVTAVKACRKSVESIMVGESTLTLSPNPAQEYVNVSLTGYSNAAISVFDVNGSLVLNQDQVENGTILNISHLSAGIYVVRIADENNASVQRLIIK
ncbi:MAG: C25 family cysteine peptidase [Bacteroidales bacterium]|nr:C25 family cysteine peptidase [Bacteroidales bacterium]